MPIAQKLNWLIQNQLIRGQYLLSPKLVPWIGVGIQFEWTKPKFLLSFRFGSS